MAVWDASDKGDKVGGKGRCVTQLGIVEMGSVNPFSCNGHLCTSCCSYIFMEIHNPSKVHLGWDFGNDHMWFPVSTGHASLLSGDNMNTDL